MYQTIHKIMLKKCKEFTKIQKYSKYIKNSTKVQIYQIQGFFQAFKKVRKSTKKYKKVQNYKNYRFCTEVQLPGMSEVCRTYIAPRTLSVYVGKGERPTNDTPLDVVPTM